ncbi:MULTISPECIES: WecB/TagA/CpsF family glycosyltransferase [unclassified Modestobacter]
MGQSHKVTELAEERWSANLASHLADAVTVGRGAAITWFNHASMSRSLAASVPIDRFDYVGIDGLLLRWLTAPAAPRTSADLVLPRLFDRVPEKCRVALVGSQRPSLDAAARAIEALPSAPKVVFTCDGYGELPTASDLANRLLKLDVQVVVVGLGAPLQDNYVLDLVECGMSHEVLLTCGGWLDQVASPTYYPSFAYRLKVNWLIRVLREPGRLWRRYTVEAVLAYRRRRALKSYLLARGGRPFQAMASACGYGAAGPPTPSLAD